MLLTHREMLNNPGITNLMRWVDQHDRPAATLFDTDTEELIVSSIECRNGVAFEVSERIPATRTAARDLLGY